MKLAWLFILTILLLPAIIIEAHAIREVAGKVNVQITPGQTKSFQWGMLSDSNSVTAIQLSAQGQGSEFLSFPKSVSLNPQALQYVNVTVSVPPTYPGNVHLTPTLFGTQVGQQNGPTIINVQIAKAVTLAIAPNPNPQIAAQGITNSTVPEFGSISAVVLAIAVMTVIAISSRRRFNIPYR